jgi:hypothetical protein
MPRPRHLIPVMAAGALASLVAWPAGAVPATEILRITTTNDSRFERVDWRRWRDDDPPHRYRYRYRYGDYDDHYPYRYGYRYRHRYGDYDGHYPYTYDYYRPRRGFGFFGPGFVFQFGDRRRRHDDD